MPHEISANTRWTRVYGLQRCPPQGDVSYSRARQSKSPNTPMIRKILTAVMLVTVMAADAVELRGGVVGVIDGDTIDVLDENKMRN